jgi:hypothetical protein
MKTALIEVATAIALAVPPGAAAQEWTLDPDDPRILVWYDFDGEDVETGPWTLTAFEDAQGSVVVTADQRWSGWRSVEVRDVAGDGDFAELQGFVRELAEGTLYFHEFSFIGDVPGSDRSDAVIWVDDLLLVADRPVPRPGPFVAPGRRMLFVDLYRHYRELLLKHPGCPPPLGPADYLSLWRQGPEAAAAFATRLIARLEGVGIPTARWLELQGDALLQAGEAGAALASYEAAPAASDRPAPLWAKLSDVHFALGDLAGERDYRERVHGSLRH